MLAEAGGGELPEATHALATHGHGTGAPDSMRYGWQLALAPQPDLRPGTVNNPRTPAPPGSDPGGPRVWTLNRLGFSFERESNNLS